MKVEGCEVMGEGLGVTGLDSPLNMSKISKSYQCFSGIDKDNVLHTTIQLVESHFKITSTFSWCTLCTGFQPD